MEVVFPGFSPPAVVAVGVRDGRAGGVVGPALAPRVRAGTTHGGRRPAHRDHRAAGGAAGKTGAHRAEREAHGHRRAGPQRIVRRTGRPGSFGSKVVNVWQEHSYLQLILWQNRNIA